MIFTIILVVLLLIYMGIIQHKANNHELPEPGAYVLMALLLGALAAWSFWMGK